MKEGPNIAMLGTLIGDPARANMLSALMSGKALTVSELASEAGVTLQTASSHLSKLEAAELIIRRKQGRHRYFSLAGDEIGHVLEVMMGFAAKHGHMRTRTGPKDPALRKARVCYNHLAGEMGVLMFDHMTDHNYLLLENEDVKLSETGRQFIRKLGIDLDTLTRSRRPLCKSCLDWSARRSHLAGSIGTALLSYFLDQTWARKLENSRVIEFTKSGEQQFHNLFHTL